MFRCSPNLYSKVSERRPRFIPFTGGAGPLTNAETGIVKAMQIDRRDPLVALGEYMSAAETALRQLERSPQDETARHTYNFTVGRVIHHPRRKARSVDGAAASAGKRWRVRTAAQA